MFGFKKGGQRDFRGDDNLNEEIKGNSQVKPDVSLDRQLLDDVLPPTINLDSEEGEDSSRLFLQRRDVSLPSFTQLSFPPFSIGNPSPRVGAVGSSIASTSAIVLVNTPTMTPSTIVASTIPTTPISNNLPTSTGSFLAAATTGAGSTMTFASPVDFASLMSALSITATSKTSTLTSNPSSDSSTTSLPPETLEVGATTLITPLYPTTTSDLILAQTSSTTTPDSNSNRSNNSFLNTLTQSPLSKGLTALISLLLLALLLLASYFLWSCCKKRRDKRIGTRLDKSIERELEAEGILGSTCRGEKYGGRGGGGGVTWDDGYEKSEEDLDVRWERLVADDSTRRREIIHEPVEDDQDWKEKLTYEMGSFVEEEEDEYNHSRAQSRRNNNHRDSRFLTGGDEASNYSGDGEEEEEVHPFDRHTAPIPQNSFIMSPPQSSTYTPGFRLSSTFPTQQPSRPTTRPTDQSSSIIPPRSAYLDYQDSPINNNNTTFDDIDLGNPSALSSASNTSFASTKSETKSEYTAPLWRTSLDRVLGAAAGFVVGKSNSPEPLEPLMEEELERHSSTISPSFQVFQSPSLHRIPSVANIVPPIPAAVPSFHEFTPRHQYSEYYRGGGGGEFSPGSQMSTRQLQSGIQVSNNELYNSSIPEMFSPASEMSTRQLQIRNNTSSSARSSLSMSESHSSSSDSPGSEVQVAHRVNLVGGGGGGSSRGGGGSGSSIAESTSRWTLPDSGVAQSDYGDSPIDGRYSRASILTQSSSGMTQSTQRQPSRYPFISSSNSRASSMLHNDSPYLLSHPPMTPTTTTTTTVRPPLPTTYGSGPNFSPFLSFPAPLSHLHNSIGNNQLLHHHHHTLRTATSNNSLGGNSAFTITPQPRQNGFDRQQQQQVQREEEVNYQSPGSRSSYTSIDSPRDSESIVFSSDMSESSSPVIPLNDNSSNSRRSSRSTIILDPIEVERAENERAQRMLAEMERSRLLLDKTRKLAQARRVRSEGTALTGSGGSGGSGSGSSGSLQKFY